MAGRRPLVLWIENEGRSRYKAPLQRHGYDVIAATSDRQGFSVLRKNAVDAIIIDLEMPGRNGDAFVRRMKQIKPHIPVVLLFSPFTKMSSGRFPAADAVMLKTEAPSQLVGILDNLLSVEFPFFARWFGNWKHRVLA